MKDNQRTGTGPDWRSRVPLIELHDLSVAYDDQVVLEDINFVVHRGEYVALIGPNGAGKTTLVRVILGLIRPTHGEVRVFGKPPWELSLQERQRIGYVPQLSQFDPHFPIAVEEAVLMGRYARMGLFRRPRPEDRAAVRRALELVGMEQLAGRQLGQLSGGQRQRVLIARALASEPELLILDEPTTSLDVRMTQGLYQLIDELQGKLNLTVIVVSHDVGVVAEMADTIACLAGRIVAHGRPGEVLTQPNLECMYGKEAVLFGHGPVPHLFVAPHEPSQEPGPKAAGAQDKGDEDGKDGRDKGKED